MLKKEAEKKWPVRSKEVRKAWSQVEKKVIKKEVEDLSTHQILLE